MQNIPGSFSFTIYAVLTFGWYLVDFFELNFFYRTLHYDSTLKFCISSKNVFFDERKQKVFTSIV